MNALVPLFPYEGSCEVTMKEVLDAVLFLNPEQRVRWLIDLGWAMTVSARAGYPLAMQTEEPIPHLTGVQRIAAPTL